MKGISTIIAAIILVVITIGLISVAYLYFSGLITGRTVTNIQLSDAYCRASDNHIFALVKNVGTMNITSQPDFVVDGSTTSFTCTPAYIEAGKTTNCESGDVGEGFKELRIIGPSNAVGGTLECK